MNELDREPETVSPAPEEKQPPAAAAAEPSEPEHVRVWHRVLLINLAYLAPEVFAAVILRPDTPLGLAFAFLWGWLGTSILMMLPRRAGRIAFGISYYVLVIWALAQTGYYQLFHRLMWLSDIFYADEGAGYLDVLKGFSVFWWLGGAGLIALGVFAIRKLPQWKKDFQSYLAMVLTVGLTLTGMFFLPRLVFLRDLSIWGSRSEYAQANSFKATYSTMYDAKKVYDISGLYHLTVRDLWQHNLYPLTPAYRQLQNNNAAVVTNYFKERGEHKENYMTGAFAGKNVVLVLMESMDDWLITPEDTPTISRLMAEGISFTDFYTPPYGSVRTFNSEFCTNTGIYLPTNGTYAFDYVTNHYKESLASQLTAQGYTAEVFHYNTPEFYSRGVFEPAVGYHAYNSYKDFVADETELFNDSILFQIPEVEELFFREGPTLNFIITRAAHLSYNYDEVLSGYALGRYPEYREKTGHEEEDCARAKARLVDDMFTDLLASLEAHGQLENTVIIAYTDHHTYGFVDQEKLLELSGVEDPLLLERTPCFIWSPGGPCVDVEKTANTSDLLPTVLNLLGVDSPYTYLGQDIFDWRYEGFAFFSDGSWITNGIACRPDAAGEGEIVMNRNEVEITEDYIEDMNTRVLQYTRINNLLLTTDYYRLVRSLS